MAITIIRKLDKLGRIVIPKDIRDMFNLESEDEIEISADDMSVILTKITRERKI